MKNLIAILLSVILLAAGAFWYWGYHKKRIVKQLIQDALINQTDSLYYVRYDSSMIDEVNGNAYFRNIYLQSDTDQQVMLQGTDSLPNVIYNIYIKGLSASGVDMPSALQNNILHARKITIDRPLIQIISTGSKIFKIEDTIALYKKIVGEFKSIYVDSFLIQNGTIIIKNRRNEKLAELSNTNIQLTKFKVDSTRDYSNVLSYFIDNIEAKVDNIAIMKKKQANIELQEVNYNAAKRALSIRKIRSMSEASGKGSLELNDIQLHDMNVKAFVEQHKIQTGNLSCAGGKMTLYSNGSDSSGGKMENSLFEFPDKFFDEIEIGSVSLGNTELIVYDKKNPARSPIRIRNVRFNVLNETKLVEGNTLRHIIRQANWKLLADDFIWTTQDNRYDLSMSGLTMDRQTSTAAIKMFTMKAKLPEAQFVSHLKKQEDYYHLTMKDIQMSGINFLSLFNESVIDVQKVNMSLALNVFTDRMLPVNTESKVGKYPHQMMAKSKVPFILQKVMLKNSSISYRERSKVTQQTGDIHFDHINATISNATNIPERIRLNPVCKADADGLILGKGKVSTHWELMLNAKDGAFSLSGKVAAMDLSVLNSIGIPLGMTSVKGTMQGMNFSMTGNDNKAQGSLAFLYQNMKITSFKMDKKGDSLKSNKVESWLGNALVMNNNPSDGKTRTGDFAHDREPNKSFFNLIWKSLFEGMKKTTLGKGGAELQKQLKKK